eukprot:6178935-Pleurochrysis_carterae.AAC.2
MSRLASLNSMAATTMTAPTAAYRLSSLHRKPAVLCAMTPHTVQLRRFAKKSAAAAPEPTTSAKEDAVPGPGDVVEGLNIYKVWRRQVKASRNIMTECCAEHEDRVHSVEAHNSSRSPDSCRVNSQSRNLRRPF